MAYKLLISRPQQWEKDLLMLPSKQQQRVLLAVRGLVREPWAENVQVKKLQHYKAAEFRLRVGRYRVLFDRDEEAKVITLYRVLSRQKLY